MSAPPVLSINIPCYRQLPFASRCVDSILGQTFGDFELTLYDDGASDEYRDYVASLADPRVRYVRNPVRLGALRNMFESIRRGSGTFTLAFHEDDLMAPTYLETAVGVLEANADVAFVAAEVRDFREAPAAMAVRGVPGSGADVVFFATRAAFVRGILGGIDPMFGSVMYRRAALDDAPPEHEALATLVDRPFLMRLVEPWRAAVIRDPLAFYRPHDAADGRHRAMGVDHVVELFRRYRAALPAPLTGDDRRLFYTYSGYWLFALYDLVPPEQRPSLAGFLFRVWREGLYEAKWRGRLGLRLLLKAAMGRRTWP